MSARTGSLRAMTTADLPVVLGLEQALFGPEAWTEGILRDELDQRESRHYVVAVDAGRIVGYAGLACFDHEAQVTTVGVVPAHRQRGLGAALLTDLVTAAAGRPMLLEVEVGNAVAQRLYERHGFRPTGLRRGYYQATGADALVMTRPGETADD